MYKQIPLFINIIKQVKYQKKMRAKTMPVTQIYQYLTQKNYNLSTDKILKQPQANPDIIWNILTFLAFSIKDTKYQQIEPTLSYLMDPQVHKQSLKRIKQYMIISEVFKKLFRNGEEYPIREILKPEKQMLYERLTVLINANKFVERAGKEYENKRVQIKLKKQLVHDLRHKLQQRLQQVQQIKLIKQKERGQYQQKIQSIENLNKELNYKKKQRLDLLNSQQLLDNELKKKTKLSNQMTYYNDDLNIRIKQLEREVIRNAPKLKKDRFALIDQYENLVRVNKMEQENWESKIQGFNEKLRGFVGLKQKTKSFRIEQKFKQVQKLTSQLSHLSSNISTEQQQIHQLANEKKQYLKKFQNMQKQKKQLTEQLASGQKKLSALEKSLNIIKQEQKINETNVKTLQEKNELSISQCRALQDKIKLKKQKFRQKVMELNLKLAEISSEAKHIIGEAFAQFILIDMV